MISTPNIFEPVNITAVEPGRSVVEKEVGTRVQADFVGRDDAGAVEPGNDCADDAARCNRSDSSRLTSGVQSTELNCPDRFGTAPCEEPPVSSQGQSRVGSESDRLGIDQPGQPTHAAADGVSQAAGSEVRKPAVTEEDIKVASLRLAAIQAFRRLTADTVNPITCLIVAKGMSNRSAARKVGYPYNTIYNWIKAYDTTGFDGLLPKYKNSGRKSKLKFSPQEVADVKALVLQTNRTHNAGSNPEAVRAAIKRGLLDPNTAALLKMRFDNGQALTPALRKQVFIPESTIEASRAPRETWLRRVESPGSLHLTIDEESGIEREIEGCEQFTMDDGTINMVCNVPFHLPGNKCSEKFGVMVGRFQLLLPVEHRYLFIPGFNYTARPRSSYRAEDLTATLQIVFTEHGYPDAVVLEKGISASDLLTQTLHLLGIKILRANSPHQKVVEGVFNRMWTKLSLMPGQVGRFQGEEEEINALITSCRSGATDPRKHFPMLADVLKAIAEAIREHNSRLVISRQYGRWVPAEKFEEFKKNLRKLEPEQQWMFSPCITEPLLVRGCKVRKTVLMMEGYSEVFDFSADWLHVYHGVRVKLYFNPFAPECVAQVVLAQDFNGAKAGTVLGYAEQINRMTRFRRRALGYGADPDIGLDATRRNAQALRRSVVAIRTDGSVGAQRHEARNGVGDSDVATNVQAPAVPAAVANPERNRRAKGMGVDEDEFSRQAARLARYAD